MTDMQLYKWLNGREATHVSGFRYRLRVWTPEVTGPLFARGEIDAAARDAAWGAARAAAWGAEREWQTARLLDYAHGRAA